MNVLLVGGSSAFMNRLIQKMKKEGHRVCLLTGNRFKDSSYDRVFESYRFSYDSESLGRVFESAAPDVTVFLGAYDPNFAWNDDPKNMPSRFMAGMINLLMAFHSVGKGRFIYLSSEEVYGGDYPQDISEREEVRPETLRGVTLAQGEKLCESFGKMLGRDIVVLRCQHLYGIPAKRADCGESVAWLCLEALRGNPLSGDEGQKQALLFESDAVEYIYQMASCQGHKSWLYNLSSSAETNELELAAWAGAAMDAKEAPQAVRNPPGRRCVLSNQRFMQEFHASLRGDTKGNVEKIAAYMKEHQDGAEAPPLGENPEEGGMVRRRVDSLFGNPALLYSRLLAERLGGGQRVFLPAGHLPFVRAAVLHRPRPAAGLVLRPAGHAGVFPPAVRGPERL